MPRKEKESFLNDECGQNALQLAARGSAIIAEILRLSEHIPNVFKQPPEKNPQYAKLICDFTYFSMQDKFEKNIQNSVELLQRDDEFRQTHIELLERFFKLFRSIHGYVQEQNRFVEEIREGLYISQTIESILTNNEGKQLMCEIHYLYGVMLLLLDYKVGGKVREYLMVSYIRYKGAGEQNTVEISSLFRDTGFRNDEKLPKMYPTQYFARSKLDQELLSMLIGRIRSDDVYQMSYNYPVPEHRSTALANQGAMLYILLFFKPALLEHERHIMREIVDKHFADNWVINYYMGFTVDLSVAWDQFEAAKLEITRTLEPSSVKYVQNRMKENLRKLNPAIAALLREGVLTEQYVLDNIQTQLLPHVREANVILRWFILHMTRGPEGRRFFERLKPSYDCVMVDVSADEILTLLLRTAQLEYTLKAMFEKLLKEKRGKWEAAKVDGELKMSKLATYFSGEHVLSNNVKVGQLEQWFTDIAERIQGLSYADSTSASRKVQKLMKALENVQEFHQIDSNLQVVQFLMDTRHLLRQMIRYINIERKVLITIATVGDLSFAWELFSSFGCFVNDIQQKIKKDPHLVIQMRSTFVKLATTLEMPCTRIAQAADHDAALNNTLESVSEYYSSELVTFVRRVLHVLPVSIFSVLKEIAKILVNNLKVCPTKLARADLKAQAQPEVRHALSTMTAQIAKYANGILAMESTLVGVIQVDPHQLLEDGIRKELTQQITYELHSALKFDQKKPSTAEEYTEMLSRLTRQLDGLRNSFEYIQDYVNVHGLRIWLEEFSRIVNFNVEMECNSFMQKKLYHWKSRFQSDSIPIPYFERQVEKDVYSFLGRIVQHLLSLTDPRKVSYIPCLGAWYDLQSMKEAVGSHIFTSTLDSIGTRGLSGLDKLLSFIVAKDLQVLVARLRRFIEPHEGLFAAIQKDLTPPSAIPLVAGKHYQTLTKTMEKAIGEATDTIVRIGRIQLLRRHIANELRSSSKLNSSTLFCSLHAVNEALLADLERHYKDPIEHPMPGEIIAELSPFMDSAGLVDPASTVYITTKPMPELCWVLMSLLIKNLTLVQYDDKLSCLTSRKKDDPFDTVGFSFGIVVILKQFHSEVKELFFAHLCQYVRVTMCDYDHVDKRQKDREVLPESASNMVRMMELMSWAAGRSVEDLPRQMPPTLMTDPKVAMGAK